MAVSLSLTPPDLGAADLQPSTRESAAPAPSTTEAQPLSPRYRGIRQQSLELCEPLTPEDMMVQSCPEASPAKWHLAHTSWFLETFILREFAPAYQPFHPDFLWLFNSYYNSVSDQPQKKLRASFSRPSLGAILAYRTHVDAAIEQLLHSDVPAEARRRIVMGLHHEQQHQELLLTDVKHAMWSNPLRPVYCEGSLPDSGQGMTTQLTPQRWTHFPGGLHQTGFAGIGRTGDDFCFDNEQPRHRVYLEPFELATRPVSCAEYLQFMQDGGYERAELWLSDGWQTVRDQDWQAPLYWHRESPDADWSVFTLRGELPLNRLFSSPVCHVSYYEADAFARWAGCKLPTEAEWEVAAAHAICSAATLNQAIAPQDLLDGKLFHPAPALPRDDGHPAQLLGAVWEWTASAYLGYPGYNAMPGALGEYNGKFMSSQMVLRGGSVATPASHIRETYRNFFPPATRWQFSGIRLARR
jgi:ergothioneine biosynthesis protein EgtB